MYAPPPTLCLGRSAERGGVHQRLGVAHCSPQCEHDAAFLPECGRPRLFVGGREAGGGNEIILWHLPWPERGQAPLSCARKIRELCA